MTTATAGRFSVGGVLGTGFEILSKNAVSFGMIALVVTLPSFIYQLINGGSPVTTNTTAAEGGFYVERSILGGDALLAVLIELILRQIAVGAISYGVFQEMRGQRVALADCLRHAVALIFPVVGVAIVSGIAKLLGLILLIVPGLIVAVMLWVAVPVAVVERPGIMRSLSRSAALTKGNRWPVFGVTLLIGVGTLVASFLVNQIFGTATPGAFAAWIVAAATSAFAASVTAVGYTTLRHAKEGISIEEIARVFD